MKRIIILKIAFWVSFQLAIGQVSTEHLNAYLWEYPLQQGLVLDSQLMEELVAEMEKIIVSDDLFFRPLPNDYADQPDDSYFLYREPGRILQTIAMAYPYLEPSMQTTLRTMVQQLFANTVHRPWAIVPGQPWVHYLLPVDAGKQRKSFTPANIWGDPNHGRYRPTIQNVYNVWLYAYRTGDAASVQPYYNAIRSFYDNKTGGHDQGRFYGTMNAHIGMARLAQMFSDLAQVAAATTNLTNALNFGLQMNLVDTLARNGTAGWNGAYAFAYDYRAINWINRNYILHNISPEIGRYLQDYLFEETEARHDYMMNRFPLWWLREAPYFNRWTGDEGIGIPGNSFGTNVPLERWFRNLDAETLASYLISSPVGIGDSYWIEALVMAIEANATDVWVDVRNTAFSTDIIELPEELILESMVLTSDSETCFAATQTIIAGGEGNILQVQDGASLTLVAGQNIRLFDGVSAESGSYFRAYITEDGNYCQLETSLIAADNSVVSESSGLVSRNDHNLFRIFPNPGSGLFTLELFSEPTTYTIEIYNTMGLRLHLLQPDPGRIHELNLLHHAPGIYLIRVVMDGEASVVKVVKH
jgi:hypothetical protein